MCESGKFDKSTLPTFRNTYLEEVIANSRKEELELILCPLHFDDGYKLQPDPNVLPNIKHVLDIFHACFMLIFKAYPLSVRFSLAGIILKRIKSKPSLLHDDIKA